MRHDGKDIGLFSEEATEENKPKRKSKKKIKISETQFKRLFKEENDPNEKPSFEEIYGSLYDKMFNQVCRKYTKDNDKAQEYCQEGFVKVWKNYEKYSSTGSLEGWVSYVIKNTILDIIRKESKMKYADSGEDSFDFERLDHPEDEQPMEFSKSMTDVRKVMNQLPPQYQKVFSLYYVDGLSHQEIAEELGISVGTSKSNLFKAKKKIQKLLGKGLYEQDEEGGGDTGGSSAPSGGGGGGWSSGASSYTSLTRGKANPIGNTVWDSGVSRGPANPL